MIIMIFCIAIILHLSKSTHYHGNVEKINLPKKYKPPIMLRPQNKYFIYVCNNLFLQVSFLLLPWHVPSTPSYVEASGAGETVIVNVVVVNVIIIISFITTIT